MQLDTLHERQLLTGGGAAIEHRAIEALQVK